MASFYFAVILNCDENIDVSVSNLISISEILLIKKIMSQRNLFFIKIVSTHFS